MLDGEGRSKAARADHQRLRGSARVSLARRRGATRLSGLAQSGSAKAMLPRSHKGPPEVVFLNTGGGLTGGDRLEYGARLDAGTAASLTTQTAERAYASLGAPAQVEVRLSAGPGAVLHWLPQETILFDRAALHRRLSIDLAGDARLVAAETIVFGRTAMGERVGWLDFLDRREVRRDGRPIFLEPLRLGPGSLLASRGPALLGSAVAISTLLVCAERAEDGLEPLRRVLAEAPAGVEAAASGWDGKLVARMASGDAFALRAALAVALRHLTGAKLPRVWGI